MRSSYNVIVVVDKLGRIHVRIAGKRGLGVTVFLHVDVIMQILEQCNSPVCWIVIYKVDILVPCICM